MDAIKLLRSLLGNKSLASGLGGSLLEGLLVGGRNQGQGGGGLASILGGMLGGKQQSGGGMLSGLLGSLLGGKSSSALGMLGVMMGGGDDQPTANQPSQEQMTQVNDQATLMIRAMISAAKSDGRIDQSEQENIISKLGEELDQAEVEFLKTELAKPVDVNSIVQSVPQGMEQQVYALSLTSIELDTQNEAQYLAKLAQGLNLDPQVCNQIHEQLGAPVIFG
ncbi:MAG: DUF533 domain-containing protein [Planctomycetota bacterium]